MLELRDVTVRYPGGGDTPAVSGVSLSLGEGGALGIAGESGCGKSTLAKAILGILPPGTALEGSILYRGSEIARAPERDMRPLRGGEISMVFQDPSAALNPVRRIKRQFYDILGGGGKEADARIEEALADVRLPEPRGVMEQVPAQLSGGMKQRVVIAAAMLKGPRLLIADEPTSAVDAAVRAQILEEFLRLRERTGVALLTISHDISELAQVCDELLIMRGGVILERGPCDALLSRPEHPYTRLLLEAAGG